MRIEAEKTDAQIGRSTVEAGAFDSPDPQMIKILEALEIIQSKTEVMFTAPASVSAHAARHIWSVAQIVNTGIATMMPPEMNFTVQEVKEMFPKFASGAKMVMQQFVDEWGAIVLNKRVSLGPVLISCDELHVSSEDRERAMNDIEGHSPDHVISVKVSPVEGTAIEAKFMAWLPEAQADAIRNMPFVRSASLNNMIQNLREASLDTNGAFNVDEFMKLLAEAKAESTNKEIVISPLLLATEQDLVQAFKAILETIAPAQRNALAARLVEAGWLRE